MAVPARRQERRRGAILRATWRLIAERGYHNVRVADIARACGTSTGTVHYWFPGKDDVLEQALSVSFEQAFARQHAALFPLDDARDRLFRLIELQVPDGAEVRGEWSVWLQFWTESVLRPQLRERNHDAYEQWRDVVRRITLRGQRQGVFRQVDPERFVTHFTALLDGLAIQVLAGSPLLAPGAMRELLLDWVARELFVSPDYQPPWWGGRQPAR